MGSNSVYYFSGSKLNTVDAWDMRTGDEVVYSDSYILMFYVTLVFIVSDHSNTVSRAIPLSHPISEETWLQFVLWFSIIILEFVGAQL